MRFSAVLFDLDGTLIDTNHLIVQTFQHVLKEKLDLDVTAADLYQYFGEPLERTLGRFAPDRALELTDAYRIFNLANHDALLKQFDGVPEAVAALSEAGVKLGVVTSKRIATARRGLAVSGLEPYFSAVVGMDETERHKPHPDPALLALARLQVTPGPYVLMVGDTFYDLRCGRAAGLRTAAVGWSMIDRAALEQEQPDYWLEHPGDLVALALAK